MSSVERLDLPSIDGRRNLREQVGQALRAALTAGKLRPGAVYSAPVLAVEFGVSATPVREAMLDLTKEGLVEAVRNKGFRVTELSDRDLNEFTEIRTLIEVPLVETLARTQPAERLERLLPLVEAIVAAARVPDLLTYVDADNRFHLELLALHGNDHLVDVVASLRKRSRLYGLPGLAQRGLLVESALEHAELLDCLVAGDARSARAVMERHLSHVRGIWADRPEPVPGSPEAS